MRSWCNWRAKYVAALQTKTQTIRMDLQSKKWTGLSQIAYKCYDYSNGIHHPNKQTIQVRHHTPLDLSTWCDCFAKNMSVVTQYFPRLWYRGVAATSRLLTIIGLFCKETYNWDDVLQKRPIVLRNILIVATPYEPYPLNTRGLGLCPSRGLLVCDLLPRRLFYCLDPS